ncbi:MAG: T9SS type A sorting domain-containing protein [Ignavibacteria bacterium]|nr:T9SS type A sorting domain-containing protein [Ignavibacteria bacterium]
MKRLILILVALLLVTALSFGQQWQMTQLTTIAGDSVSKIYCKSVEYLSSGAIWIAAGDYPFTGKCIVYLSTDNGTTWVKRPLFTQAGWTSPGMSNITAKDGTTALLGLQTGEILRTTNGGVKWDTVTAYSTPDDGWIDGVKYIGKDTVVAYGDAMDSLGVYFARSTNGGTTWTRFTNWPNDSLKTKGIYAGSFTYGQAMDVNGKNIWCSLYNTANDPASILKSTDGGTTWSWFRVTLPGGPAMNYVLSSISFKDANVGFAVGRRAYVNTSAYANYLCKTTDGGRTWGDTLAVEPGKGHVNTKVKVAKGIPGTNTVIAVGYNSLGTQAWKSDDNGTTWAAFNPPSNGVNSDFTNLAFGSSTQGIMVGYQNIVKISLATAVENPKGQIPEGFALDQNYPNPFNPTTTISYSVPKTSFVELKVYDLLGRTIATLINNEQVAGTHSVVFDANGLSSGVYLYTMKAGDFTATKSLVLVK